MQIKIIKLNESYYQLITNNKTLLKNLHNHYSFPVKNAKFIPHVKKGFWNGKISFFYKNGQFAQGILKDIEDYLNTNNYSYEKLFKDKTHNISKSDIQFIINELNTNYQLRDYQLNGILLALNKKKIAIESVTSSGKSLIIACICKYLLNQNKRILIICPQINLVEQMYYDFKDYFNDLHLSCNLQHSQSNQQQKNKLITISTWQSILSILRKNKYYLQQFDVLIQDECHLFKANETKKIAEQCINAKYKIGFSGTYPDDKRYADYWTIKAYIGDIIKITEYKELIKNNYISDIEIKCVILKYPIEDVMQLQKIQNTLKITDTKRLKIKQYNLENDFLYQHEERNKFILSLAQKLPKNSLFLFKHIEKHGKKLLNLFKKHIKNKTILYIDGTIPVEEREKYRKLAEERNDIILLCSYGTFSLGVSIKNLHYIVFCSSYKSKFKVIQSIGRGLRKHKDKNKAIIIDIVDDLSTNQKKNYNLLHFYSRLKRYKEHQFNYTIKKKILDKKQEK